MDHIRRVVIGLGSNVGDRVKNVLDAVERLRADGDLYVTEVSALYETEPVGGPPQGDFVNAAVLVLTSVEARDLLGRLLVVERELGRERGEKNGPRTIDLDILWIEGESIVEEGLEVPHARLLDRAFALRPLLDLAPDARHAGTGVALADAAAASVTLRRLA